jgi:hypothetical protein
MTDLAKEFEKHYQAWKSFVDSDEVALSSFSKDYIKNPHFEAIVKLGPEVVPNILDKLRTDETAHFLVHALERITKKSFTREEMIAGEERYGSPLGNQGLAAMWQDWWRQQQSGERKK